MPIEAPRRVTPWRSSNQDTPTSISEIDEVKAANRASAKNTTAKAEPYGIASNATGIEMKKRLGPEASGRPAANTIGKMGKPAMIATSVAEPPMMAEARG